MLGLITLHLLLHRKFYLLMVGAFLSQTKCLAIHLNKNATVTMVIMLCNISHFADKKNENDDNNYSNNSNYFINCCAIMFASLWLPNVQCFSSVTFYSNILTDKTICCNFRITLTM